MRRLSSGILALAAGFALVLGLLPATAAFAASSLGLDVTITDPANPGPTVGVVDPTMPGGMQSYQVNMAFSCTGDTDCANVVLHVASTPLDPTYSTHRKETGFSLVQPGGGLTATLTGNVSSGFTISLGTVPHGSSGVVGLQYKLTSSGGGAYPGSFFVNGSAIVPGVTIDADGMASGSDSTPGTATWVSAVPPNSGYGVAAAPAIRTGTDLVVTATGASNCAGSPWLTCGKDYTSVITLPAGATYVAGSAEANGGTYDAASNTVTFTKSGVAAAGGSGARTFTVRFDPADYPTTMPGCLANVTFNGAYQTTYLDGTVDNRTASSTTTVQNCAPFSLGSLHKYVYEVSNGALGQNVPIPLVAGTSTSNYAWQVEADNEANAPGVATIVDNDLDQPDVPVTSIRLDSTGTAQIHYTLDDDTTGDVTLSVPAAGPLQRIFNAPTGRHIAAVTAVSSPLNGPNKTPTDNPLRATPFVLTFITTIADTATPGTRTNDASGSLSYPDTTLPDLDLGTVSRVMTLQHPSNITLSGALNPPTVVGGGTPVVDSTVAWSMRPSTSNVAAGVSVIPQYVFLAPLGWTIQPGSAALSSPAPTIPATFQYTTVTFQGQTYNAVIATAADPMPVGSGSGSLLTVSTSPTAAATAGSNNQKGYFFVTNTAADPIANYSPATYDESVAGNSDINGDGAPEVFAEDNASTSLAPQPAVSALKQICIPDADQTDGCNWQSSGSVQLPLPATSIKYRLTVQNTGTAPLSGVISYDVLPHIGDTGTIDATASTSRGSTVNETLIGVSDVDPAITLAYSDSTNPARPEVYSGSTALDDWGSTVAGSNAIRATVASLAAHQSASFVYTTRVLGGVSGDQACNSAGVTATGLAPVEPAAVCASLAFPKPALSLAKTSALTTDQDGDGEGDAGDVITYTFEVANTGAGDAHDVTIDDALTGLSAVTPATGDVASGDSASFTATYTITAADVEAGTIHNSATANGLDHDGDPVSSPPASNTFTPLRDPSLTLVKDADLRDTNSNGLADAGESIVYTFTVTNDGDTKVADVSITDAKLATAGVDITPASADVPKRTVGGADGSVVFTSDPYAVTQADVDAGKVANKATASGTDPRDDQPLTSPDASTTTATVAAAPALSLAKTASFADTNGNALADEGEAVTYSFVVTNTGNVTVDGVRIVDALAGLSAVAPAGPASIAPGDTATFSATYVVTAGDADSGELDNTATASGTDPSGGAVDSPPSSTATETTGTGGLDLVKSSALTGDANSDGKAEVGDTVTYTFAATNTGNRVVSGVSIDDPLVPATTPVSTDVAAGDTATFTGTYAVTQADVDAGKVVNTATATGVDRKGGLVTATATNTFTTVAAAPLISLTKTASLRDTNGNGSADRGEQITYTLVVTNTGNVTLSGVRVTDPMVAGLPAPFTLAPDASRQIRTTYTVTVTDAQRTTIVNTATATGTDPAGATVISKAATATTPVTGPSAAKLAAHTKKKKVSLPVRSDGSTGKAKIRDVVRLTGLTPAQASGTVTVTVTLYGPSSSSKVNCGRGDAAGTVTLTAKNGKWVSPPVKVSKPGHYAWVVSVAGTHLSTGCGLAAQHTLVRRPAYGTPVVSTGFTGSYRLGSGVGGSLLRRLVNRVSGAGFSARVSTVGLREGAMQVPSDVDAVGWLRQSAAIGDAIGTTVIAGHVSDDHDVPGAFHALLTASHGQVVTVDGHRFRVTRVATYSRNGHLPHSLFSTTGAHRLVLITCTGRETLPHGHFHYTRNQVVIATPIG